MPMARIPKSSTCPNTTNISDRPVHAKRNRLNYNASEPGTKIGQPHYATPILVDNRPNIMWAGVPWLPRATSNLTSGRPCGSSCFQPGGDRKSMPLDLPRKSTDACLHLGIGAFLAADAPRNLQHKYNTLTEGVSKASIPVPVVCSPSQKRPLMTYRPEHHLLSRLHSRWSLPTSLVSYKRQLILIVLLPVPYSNLKQAVGRVLARMAFCCRQAAMASGQLGQQGHRRRRNSCTRCHFASLPGHACPRQYLRPMTEA